MNDHIRALAIGTPRVLLADVHAHFLGHGVSAAEDDRWYWRRSLIEPNAARRERDPAAVARRARLDTRSSRCRGLIPSLGDELRDEPADRRRDARLGDGQLVEEGRRADVRRRERPADRRRDDRRMRRRAGDRSGGRADRRRRPEAACRSRSTTTRRGRSDSRAAAPSKC